MQLDELRKGRSKVLEKDHTLILGWNSKVFPIVSEICIANFLTRGGSRQKGQTRKKSGPSNTL